MFSPMFTMYRVHTKCTPLMPLKSFIGLRIQLFYTVNVTASVSFGYLRDYCLHHFRFYGYGSRSIYDIGTRPQDLQQTQTELWFEDPFQY